MREREERGGKGKGGGVGREGGEPPTFITKFTPMRRPLGLLIGIPNRRLE